MSPPLYKGMKQTPAGLQFQVKLTPKAARNAIMGWAHDADGAPVLKVTVTAIAEKNKANQALIAMLAKEWRLARQDIILLRGSTDRNKTLLLKDISVPPENMPPLPPSI